MQIQGKYNPQVQPNITLVLIAVYEVCTGSYEAIIPTSFTTYKESSFVHALGLSLSPPLLVKLTFKVLSHKTQVY